MKSKVKSVTFSREWKNPAGRTFYYFDIEFENGDKGQFGTIEKNQTKFVVGQEHQYQETKKNNKGVPVYDVIKEQQRSYNDPKNNKNMARSVCQSVAVELFLANGKPLNIDSVKIVGKALAAWVTAGPNNRDEYSLKWNAMMRSQKLLMFPGELKEIKTVSDLVEKMIAYSEEFMNDLEEKEESSDISI